MRSRALRFALTVSALGFVAWSAYTLRERWEGASANVDPLPALIAFVVVIAAVLLLALAWTLLIRTLLPSRPPIGRMLAVYAISGLGKYVPGKVGQPVLRMSGVAPYGGSLLLVGGSMAIELLSWIAVGSLIAAVLIFFGTGELDDTLGVYAIPVGVLSLLAALALATIDHARYPAFVRNLLRIEAPGPILPWSTLLVHAAHWSLWALHGVLLARAVGLMDLSESLQAAAFVVLAPIAGFLAVPMPAGVGVRESFIVRGLAPSVGAANALAAALLSRVATLGADVLLWLVLSRKYPEVAAPEPAPKLE